MSRSDGASKAFAGEVLCGCIHVEDSAVLNFGKYSFKLEILGCEKVLWQPVDILTPEDGVCGIATSVDDRDLLEKLLREKGGGFSVVQSLKRLTMTKLTASSLTKADLETVVTLHEQGIDDYDWLQVSSIPVTGAEEQRLQYLQGDLLKC